MSFWDQLRPAVRTPRGAELSVSDDRRSLLISWDDGAVSQLGSQLLRQRCPCAGCIDEWTSAPTLDPATVPEDLPIVELSSVGNYALSFVFGDSHRTGIYPWPLLRSLAGLPA